jgi:hypothetical protein
MVLLLALLFPCDYQRGKQAKPKSRYVPKIKKINAPARPREKTDWEKCGDICPGSIFYPYYNPLRLPSIKGKILDIAVNGDTIYVLVGHFNMITDAVVLLDRSTKKIITIWGIGRYRASAIEADTKGLWVLGSQPRHFLRRLSYDGSAGPSVSISAVPEGKIGGLAVLKNGYFFYTIFNGFSNLYFLNNKSLKYELVNSFKGRISSITMVNGKPAAVTRGFDVYSNRWLVFFNEKGVFEKKMRYINMSVKGMAFDGRRLLVLGKDGDRDAVYPVLFFPEKNLVLGMPYRRRVEIKMPVSSRNSSLYRADMWIAIPENSSSQQLMNIELVPKPDDFVMDKFGNRWAKLSFEKQIGSTSAEIKFDALTCAAAYTLNVDTSLDASIPEDIREKNTSETYAFDLSNYVIKSHCARVPAGSSLLNSVIAIRNYIIDTLRHTSSFFGGTASAYLFKGSGDDYGHTLAFIAMTRWNKIPSRAACAIDLSRSAGDQKSRIFRIWSQVYFPQSGWVDMDIARDDLDTENRSFDNFAYKPANYLVTYKGDFDKQDYKSIFSLRNSLRSFSYTGIDKNKEYCVRPGKITIKTTEF